MVEFTPEKSKKIALARLDLLNQWKEFRKKSDNKLQADYDFVNLHNTSNSYLFEILGKISRGTLHRWKNILNGTEDYTKLIPQYKYAKVDEYRTCLTDEEIKVFMGLLLHPNRLCIGKAIALTKYKLKEQGQSYIQDLKQIFDQLSEITVNIDAIEFIHKKYNRFRQIVQLINQLEIIGKDNNLQEINLDVIKEIL